MKSSLDISKERKELLKVFIFRPVQVSGVEDVYMLRSIKWYRFLPSLGKNKEMIKTLNSLTSTAYNFGFG